MKKVIILGAGIVGASVAYHLSKQDVEVVVVDKSHKGQATAAGAGIVCPWLSKQDNPHWYELAKTGASYYPYLIEELRLAGETDVGYKLVGALAVSEDTEELDELEELVKQRKRNNPEVGEISRLSPEETRKLFPPLWENFHAIHITGGARVDGGLLKDALLRAAEKQGIKRYIGEGQLITEKNKVIGVQLGENELYADSVVVTAGAWAQSVLKPHGVHLPIEPQKGQIVHLKLSHQDTTYWPVVFPTNSSHYLLGSENSRVIAGATRESGSGFDYRKTAGGIEEVLGEALAVAPGLEYGEIEDIRVGFRPVGPDITPFIGAPPNIEGVIVANGLGSTGLTIGPFVGSVVASLLLNEKIEIDLSPYAIGNNRSSWNDFSNFGAYH
ncbi:FAD-binding oxidoreductase [Evansella sp. AB-P1]|uniref:NAD(P)/FAD-dependent oxidoreductase n=1 Tax=Evansella sp. AB-P1 TaxID=3037653 RepID=UPI00241E1CB8|nr:FAD-binding oxidoreductase [Evansella sp. AB-P1]MDG5790070.1 FAD-binding oxidoreductase [Evansella sp. AB-P1]